MAKKSKSIIVTVSDDALQNIHQIAAKLGAKGMKVDRILPVTGVIAGSSPPSKMPALQKIEGILSVEEEVTTELPPPDSPVQ